MAKRKNSVLRRALLLVVCVYLLFSLGDLEHEYIKQRSALRDEIEKKNIISRQIDELKDLLENGTEADIIEKAARERLGFVYSDEQIFVDISGN